MDKKIQHKELRGLPGGPNEMFTYTTGVFSTEGFRMDSPDVNNYENIIPSGSITMKERDGSPLRKGPIHGVDNLGNEQVMYPGYDYEFPGTEVKETLLAKMGGALLDKTIKCSSCGWEWKAADGGSDIYNCHKCPGKGVVKAQPGYEVPKMYPAPSLELQKKIQSFVAQEDAKKKAIIKEQEELKKQLKDKPVIATLKRNYNNAMNTDTLGPYGYGYTQEQQRFFESNNIPTHLWAAEKKRLDEQAVVQRRKDVQQQAIKDINAGNFTTARAENLGNDFRFFPEDADSFIDNYINPFQMVGSIAGNLGRHFASDAGPLDLKALALDVAAPLVIGAIGGLGAKSTGQFVNNLVNPVAGTGRYLQMLPFAPMAAKQLPAALRSIPQAKNIKEVFGTLKGIPTEKSLPRMSTEELKIFRQVQDIGRMRATGKPISQQYKYALEQNIPEEHLKTVFNKSKTEIESMIPLAQEQEAFRIANPMRDRFNLERPARRTSHSDMMTEQQNAERNARLREVVSEQQISDFISHMQTGSQLNSGRILIPGQERQTRTLLQTLGDDVSRYVDNKVPTSQIIGSKIDKLVSKYPYYDGPILENVPSLSLSSSGNLKKVSDKVIGESKSGINSGDVFTGSLNTSHSSYLPQLKQVFKYTDGSPQFLGYKPMNSLGFLSDYNYSADDIAKYLNTEIDLQIKRGVIPKDVLRPYSTNKYKSNNQSVFLPHYGIKEFQNGGEETSWTAYLNPANWGTSRYDDAGTFKEAFRAARNEGESDFLWRGTRYTTKLKEPASVAAVAPVKKPGGITPELLIRQAYRESRFNPNAISPAGFKGIGQIGSAVIKDYKKANNITGNIDPFNVKQNTDVQKYSMNELYNSSFINKPGQSEQVRLAKTLASYNWGRGNVIDLLTDLKKDGVDIYNSLDWINKLPKESRNYINDILFRKNTTFNTDFSKAVANQKNSKIKSIYGFEGGGEIKPGSLMESYNKLLEQRKIGGSVEYNKKQYGGQLNSNNMQLYKDYIKGAIDDNLEAIKNYDKLNRLYYTDAKELGMSVPNYIMTHLIGSS